MGYKSSYYIDKSCYRVNISGIDIGDGKENTDFEFDSSLHLCFASKEDVKCFIEVLQCYLKNYVKQPKEE